MATFLKNNADIIIDAILTDQGRIAMAENEPERQRITQFALFDDEIDYSLYAGKYGHFGEEHASGSAYFDLDILQRPVLQAFSKNRSGFNSKLVTIEGRPNFLPILKLNFNRADYAPEINSSYSWGNVTPTGFTKECFLVLFDQDTVRNLNGFDENAGVVNSFSLVGANSAEGINFLNAFDPTDANAGLISIEHGIDSDIDPLETDEYLKGDYDLYETEFFIETTRIFPEPYSCRGERQIGRISNNFGNQSHFDPKVCASIRKTDITATSTYDADTMQTISPNEAFGVETFIEGPRSHRLNFRLGFGFNEGTIDNIVNEPKHFEENGVVLTTEVSLIMFGQDITYATAVENSDFYEFKYIDSEINVYAGKTGYSIAVPVRYLKLFKY